MEKKSFICRYFDLSLVIRVTFLKKKKKVDIQDRFVPSLAELCLIVLDKKVKIWKNYRQTEEQTDDGQQGINKAHFSYQFRWADKDKKSLAQTLLIEKQ